MLKIYAGYVLVKRRINNYNFDWDQTHAAHTVLANNYKEALGLLLEKCRKEFPTEKRWYDHYVSVVEVPSDWYEIKG